MKLRTIPLKCMLLLLAFSALAVRLRPFTGWGMLTDNSSDIVIARCTKSAVSADAANKDEVVVELRGGLVYSDIELAAVLKGATNSGSSRVMSQYRLQQGEYYMVFANLHDGFYEAPEPYRVVPLGLYFSTNRLTGQPLPEQIQTALRCRLEIVNRELDQMLEEKKRLEGGLGKKSGSANQQ